MRPFVGVAGIVRGIQRIGARAGGCPLAAIEVGDIGELEQRALGWSKYVKFRKCKLDQRNVGRMGRLLGGARLRGDAE